MRGRFPIPRSRRGLLVAGAALAVVLGGVAAGLTVALTGASGGDRGLTRASFPGYELEFRYPAGWQRHDWCWVGTSVFPLTLLTTSHATQPCQENSQFGSGTPLPSPQRVDRDGVSVWWFASNRRTSARLRPNATVDGQPARITVQRESTRRTEKSYVNCNTGTRQRFLTALIRGTSSDVSRIEVGAVICGPDFSSGLADVRRMLDSVRFTS